jgi:uncharacterized protein YndB with AHSA1/START domain
VPYLERSVEIAASPQRVYAVLTDVERWPEWTASIERLRRLDDGAFTVASRARVKPAGVREGVWTVTRVEEGEGFDWETRPLPGLRIVAGHWISQMPHGCRVTLSLRSSGPLAAVTSRLVLGATSQRNVQLEAEGLKRRSESLA